MMIRFAAVLLAAILLAGCQGGNLGSAISGLPKDGLPEKLIRLDGREPVIARAANLTPRFNIREVELILPADLEVSEANRYFPSADVVWRGDPAGDRIQQIRPILEEGLKAGVASVNSGPEAALSIKLERFHALTEKARFSVGGIHDLIFVLTVRELGTDRVLDGPRRVEVAIRASGGDEAIAEDVAGRTQRVVIIEGLAEGIRRELSVMPVAAAQ